MLKSKKLKLAVSTMTWVLATGLVFSPLNHLAAAETIEKLSTEVTNLENKSKSINSNSEASNLTSEVDKLSDSLNTEAEAIQKQTESLSKDFQSLSEQKDKNEAILLHKKNLELADQLLKELDRVENNIINNKNLEQATQYYDAYLWFEARGKKDKAEKQLEETLKLYPNFLTEGYGSARTELKKLRDEKIKSSDNNVTLSDEEKKEIDKKITEIETRFSKAKAENENKKNTLSEQLKNENTKNYVDAVLNQQALDKVNELKGEANVNTERYQELEKKVQEAEKNLEKLIPNYADVKNNKSSIEELKKLIGTLESDLEKKSLEITSAEESEKSIKNLIKKIDEIKNTIKSESNRINALINVLILDNDDSFNEDTTTPASPEEVTVPEDATPLGSAPEEAAPAETSEEVVNLDADAEVEEVVIEDEETAKGEAVLPTDVDVNLNKKKSNVKDANSSNKSVNKNVLAKNETNVLAKTGGLSVNLFTMLTQFSLLIGALFLAIKASKK